MLLTVKILLTLLTLGYSAIPAAFDSNPTHATNPSWTGHARYHVVWQVSSFVYLAALALFLIWTAGDATQNLWIVIIIATCTYGGFWTAFLSRPIYGGRLVDEVNGVPPFNWNIGGKVVKTDANVTIFTPAVTLLAITYWLLFSIAA